MFCKLLPGILFIDFLEFALHYDSNHWSNFTLVIIMIFIISQNYVSISFSYFSAHYHLFFYSICSSQLSIVSVFSILKKYFQDPFMVVKFLSPLVHKSPLIFALKLGNSLAKAQKLLKIIFLQSCKSIVPFAYYLRDQMRSLTEI